MQHVIDALHGLTHGGQVANVHLANINLAVQVGDVLAAAGGEVVDDADALSPRRDVLGKV